jgi:hypothetical protein
MQNAIALFPESSFERSALSAPRVPTPSGFFATRAELAAPSLAAAVVLALHRGLIAEPPREYLPLRVAD